VTIHKLVKPLTYELSRDSWEMFAFWSRRFSKMITSFLPKFSGRTYLKH